MYIGKVRERESQNWWFLVIEKWNFLTFTKSHFNIPHLNVCVLYVWKHFMQTRIMGFIVFLFSLSLCCLFYRGQFLWSRRNVVFFTFTQRQNFFLSICLLLYHTQTNSQLWSWRFYIKMTIWHLPPSLFLNPWNNLTTISPFSSLNHRISFSVKTKIIFKNKFDLKVFS